MSRKKKRNQAVKDYRKWKFTNLPNSLLPNVLYMERLAKILISISEGIVKKFLSRLWVGRRKKPFLGYVPKNEEKRIQSVKGKYEIRCS